MCRRSGNRSAARLVLVAYCALVFVFLMLPLIIVFPISMSADPYLRFPPSGFSWQWFDRFFGDPTWTSAAVRSLQVASATTLVTLFIGVPLSFSLVRGNYLGRAVIDRMVAAPIIVPTIIISIAVYGFFAQLQMIGTWYGLTFAHTILALPFVVIIVSAGLRTFDESLEDAAVGLGASKFTAIWRVTLPQIRPSIVSAAFLAFITSFDELIIAMFLSGANFTLPKKMFDNIRMEIDPTVAAVSVIQIVVVTTLLLIWAASRQGMAKQGENRSTS